MSLPFIKEISIGICKTLIINRFKSAPMSGEIGILPAILPV